MSNPVRLARSVLLAGWLTLCLSGAAAAGSATVLRTDPPTLGLQPNGQATMTLMVENAQDLYGAEFHLTFDPNVVEVVDADAAKPGLQIQSGDWLTNTFVAVNQTDNAAGKIDYAVTLLNPAPPMSGSGVLAVITFKAKANGNTVLKIDKALLATRDGVEIKAEWKDGAIGVSSSGKAPELTAAGAIKPAAATSDDSMLVIAASVGVFVFVLALGAVVFVLWRRRSAAEATEDVEVESD
jgi:hypothetical protein